MSGFVISMDCVVWWMVFGFLDVILVFVCRVCDNDKVVLWLLGVR